MKSVTYLIFLFLMCLLPVVSRANDINQEEICYLTKEDGLAGRSVNKIITDHNGQIWIATNDGVSRYNGKVLMTIPMQRKRGERNYIFDIAEGADKAIYVTKDNGVWRLAPADKEFRRIAPYIGKASTVLKTADALYVGTEQGLCVVKGERHHTITVDKMPMSRNNSVRQIVADAQGNIWFASRYRLNIYHPKTGRLESLGVTGSDQDKIALTLLAVYPDKVYIGTKSHGLLVWNRRSHKTRRIEGVGDLVTSVNKAPGGLLTVSTAGTGAFLVRVADGTILAHFSDSPASSLRLPGNMVNYYYRDANGVDWLGFNTLGMAHTYHSENMFRLYRLGSFSTRGLEVHNTFLHDGIRLIGTDNGIYVCNERSGQVSRLSSEQLNGAHIIANIAFYKGFYYLGSNDAGLIRLRPGSLTLVPDPSMDWVDNTTVGTITIGKDGRLWAGTSDGLLITDGEGHSERYTEEDSHIIGGCVSGIYFAPNGMGWLAGRTGLCLYSPQTHTFVNTGFPKGFFQKEPLTQCVASHDGLIYFVGTTLLYFTDFQMKHFGSRQLPPPLDDEYLYSFLDDRQGHYWISTESGLYCSNYDFSQTAHFGNGEGMNCQDITSKLSLDAEGRVWIGTSNGLFSVLPKDLDAWRRQTKFKTVVYDIQKDGLDVDFAEETAANDRHSLSLTWNLTSQLLSLKAVLEDYARPQGRIFEYRLDKDDWTGVHDGDAIQLSHLSLGHHQLAIRLAGAPGTMQVFDILVRPSVGAWVELFLLLAILGGALTGWHLHRRKSSDLLQERQVIEEALVEAQEEQQQAEEQLILASEEKETDENGKDTDDSNARNKYSRVKIDPKEAEALVGKVRKMVADERLFTHPDLKLSDLADRAGVSASRLSMTLSHYLGQSYYEFINQYRLDEFKRLIDAGEYKYYTLIALSEKCGFKKSNFFATFRKVEGMTPNEYLKQKGIQPNKMGEDA